MGKTERDASMLLLLTQVPHRGVAGRGGWRSWLCVGLVVVAVAAAGLAQLLA
jgi:hypothetical protein